MACSVDEPVSNPCRYRVLAYWARHKYQARREHEQADERYQALALVHTRDDRGYCSACRASDGRGVWTWPCPTLSRAQP